METQVWSNALLIHIEAGFKERKQINLLYQNWQKYCLLTIFKRGKRARGRIMKSDWWFIMPLCDIFNNKTKWKHWLTLKQNINFKFTSLITFQNSWFNTQQVICLHIALTCTPHCFLAHKFICLIYTGQTSSSEEIVSWRWPQTQRQPCKNTLCPFRQGKAL